MVFTTITLRITTGSETLQVDDVMEDEELKFGPNGGLVFCLEFLLENISWLEEALDSGEKLELFFILVSVEIATEHLQRLTTTTSSSTAPARSSSTRTSQS